jgi:hypothetical protein
VRTIRDTRGSELRVARSADGHALTVQATLSTTRILDRRGVRARLDIIASSSEFRHEMHNALARLRRRPQPPFSLARCIASTAASLKLLVSDEASVSATRQR